MRLRNSGADAAECRLLGRGLGRDFLSGSLRRLTYRDDGMVHYQGRFHPGLGRDHQFVTPVEFLAMLVPHIALRYEVKIRTYGALSTTIRQ